MRKWVVKSGVALLFVAAMTGIGTPVAMATVSGSGICWVPDWEFPVPCAYLDED